MIGKRQRQRKKGKVIHCEEIDNGNDEATLNGEIRLLDEHNIYGSELQQQSIFFYAPLKLQLLSNDLISFDISYFDDGRPYATNIKIVKYGGIRYTAHIEELAADILRCSVFNENRNLEVCIFYIHPFILRFTVYFI